jgi:membrane peptidoglycan carboxypeptidase
VAAKTGTSNKKIGRALLPNNDLTIGFTPSLAAGVWVGNTDGKNMRSSAYSLYTSDPIYHDFFVEALKDKPNEDFPKPEGLIWKGREVYPSFAQFKNWDKMFKRIDATQETQDSGKTIKIDVPPPSI